MKRIFAIILTIAILLVPIIWNCAEQGKAIQSDCDCISCGFAEKVERYDGIITNDAQVIVDRIEGDYTVVEFSKDDTIKMLDIFAEDINGKVSEGMEIPVIGVEGKFYDVMICADSKGIEDTYYQFRSDDGSVWWILTAKEIGHIPNTEDKYKLYYTDNGTAEETPGCDCLPGWECECYLYDDIFFYIESKELC